jgi:glycosyltransferase involved in cell wall biosynthesis
MVSVIVPMRNVAAYVVDALGSVCRQREGPLEVLVVDDHSTDQSAEVVRAYGDARVRTLTNEGRGIAAGFNTGLRHARGEYVTRCDADDWFAPGRVARQVEWMERHPDVAVCCGLQEICWEDGEVVLEAPCATTTCGSVSARICSGGTIPRTVTAIYRTEALRSVGGCRPYFRTCEDDDLMMRLAERYDVWEVPELVYRTRLRPTSITRTTATAELRWFVERAYEFQRQRRETGTDDLERGRPPRVPEHFASSSARPVAWFAQDYLFADAWRYLDAGDGRVARRKCWRALRFAPGRAAAWRQGARLLALSCLRRGRPGPSLVAKDAE